MLMRAQDWPRSISRLAVMSEYDTLPLSEYDKADSVSRLARDDRLFRLPEEWVAISWAVFSGNCDAPHSFGISADSCDELT
jgi:hypothetical protein